MKIRPLIFGFRTLLVLFYLKVFHRVDGWKYFFGSFSVFRVKGGNIRLSSGVWIEELSFCQCEGGDIYIGKRTFINRLVTIVSRSKVDIGDDVLIGDNVSIYDHDHQIASVELPYGKQGFDIEPVKISNNVWVGSHCVILKGVCIGINSIVAAGSVVTKSIPSGEIWGGIPAKFIKKVVKSKEASN